MTNAVTETATGATAGASTIEFRGPRHDFGTTVAVGGLELTSTLPDRPVLVEARTA